MRRELNMSDFTSQVATGDSLSPTMRKPRLPRFKRVVNPPPFVLTPRDQEILRQAYLFQAMTREQIEALLFPPDKGQDHATKTSRVRRRLALLYHHRYLERFPIPVAPGTWAWQPVYRLGPKGADLVAQELHTTAARLPYWGKGFDKQQRATSVGLLFVDHMLKTNDIRVAVTLAAKAHGYTLEKWIDDTEFRRQEMRDYVSVMTSGTEVETVPVIPDAYFVLNVGERRAHFFLELDQGTMTHNRWRKRVLAYNTYVEMGKYRERYQTRSLRILTVTTSPERLANLKKTTEKTNGERMFWFTTLAEATAEKILFSPIWHVAGHTEATPLIS